MRYWRLVAAAVCALTLVGCSIAGGGSGNQPDTSKFDKKCANHPQYKMCKTGTTKP